LQIAAAVTIAAGREKMDIDVKELIVLTLLACFGLVLAWVQQENLFAAVFAVEAAVAVFEAVYLSR